MPIYTYLHCILSNSGPDHLQVNSRCIPGPLQLNLYPRFRIPSNILEHSQAFNLISILIRVWIHRTPFLCYFALLVLCSINKNFGFLKKYPVGGFTTSTQFDDKSFRIDHWNERFMSLHCRIWTQRSMIQSADQIGTMIIYIS